MNNPLTLLEILFARAKMMEIATGTPEAAQKIANRIHPNDQETGNVIAVEFGGWREVAQRFPEIFNSPEMMFEKDPNYNAQTLVGITAMCRAKGFELYMEGIQT